MGRTRKATNPYKSQLRALVLLLVLVVLLAVTLIVKPSVIRWSHLRHLTDSDLVQREQALNYVVRLGRHDPAVVSGAIARLSVKDEKNFLQIVNAIDRAGQWLHPPVTDEAWLRWLGILVKEQNPTARVLAAHYLAELPELVNHYPQLRQGGSSPVVNLLNHLFYDENDDVRYAALLASAELDGKTEGQSTETLPLLLRAANDKNPEIARHAWIFLGLSPAPGFYIPPDWATAARPPAVAEAMIWAISHDHLRDDPGIAIEAAGNEKLPPLVRAMGIYALHENHTQAAAKALGKILEHAHDPVITNQWQTYLVRAALSADGIPPSLRRWNTTPPPLLPVIAASCYRSGERVHLDTQPTSNPATEPSRDTAQDLVDLAALEGAPPPGRDYPVDREIPDMLRLAAVAAALHPKPEDLRPLLASNEPTLRDIACVVAADRFTKDQNVALVDSLLRDFDDNAKLSGAVLAGMTGVQGGLLTKKMNDENVWSVKLVMKLGLWMQGKMPEMARTARELFVRTDIPKSTLVLVLLHQKNPAGLDFLLNPRGEPPVDLVLLFDQQRWWRVMAKYLPGAPPLWVWADPELEQFQIDVLRDWYLVNREKLYPR